MTKKEKDALEAAKKESKKSKKENIEILKKHFHDRTLQPLSEFKKVGEKEADAVLQVNKKIIKVES